MVVLNVFRILLCRPWTRQLPWSILGLKQRMLSNNFFLKSWTFHFHLSILCVKPMSKHWHSRLHLDSATQCKIFSLYTTKFHQEILHHNDAYLLVMRENYLDGLNDYRAIHNVSPRLAYPSRGHTCRCLVDCTI